METVINKFVKYCKNALTQKRLAPPSEYFKQDCVFAHSEQVGDVKIFQMQSGKMYVAELVKIENPYRSLDDTAQRDLTWKVLDTVHTEYIAEANAILYTFTKYDPIALTREMIGLYKDDRIAMLNEIFCKRNFPEQLLKVRFLRG